VFKDRVVVQERAPVLQHGYAPVQPRQRLCHQGHKLGLGEQHR
jgi:hypothetical protein